MKTKKIYYWSPFIDRVATIKAVCNSAQSINKYSSNNLKAVIIDVFGEWQQSSINLEKINFYKLNFIPFLFKFSSYGFFKSRLKYIIIFLFCFFPLKRFLKKKKPEFLIIHLITSLPIFLNLIFNFDTKLILRISGKPKLNFFRRFFWKIGLKKIYKITCPTIETLNYLKEMNLTDNEKYTLLYDPVINMREYRKVKIQNYKKDKIELKDYYLAIGRLVKQKNFEFLIKCFQEIQNIDPNIKLLILGEGEEKEKLNKLILKCNLEMNIFLKGYQEDVYEYLYNCKAFILSSLWEDPGFVVIEAMLANTLVLSSDCSSGPKEIIGKNRGFLFNNNSKKSFIEKFKHLNSIDGEQKKYFLVNSKNFIKRFSSFSHYKNFSRLLLSNE